MGRKVISLMTLLVFMIFSYSCYTTSEKKVETVAKWKIKKTAKVKVLAVMKKDGKKIEFEKDHPGKIIKNGVKGKKSKRIEKEFALKKDKIKEVKSQKTKASVVITKDGRMLEFDIYQQIENKYIFKCYKDKYEPLFIPFSDIEWLKVKKHDGVKTVFAGIGILAGLWVAALGIILIGGGPL